MHCVWSPRCPQKPGPLTASRPSVCRIRIRRPAQSTARDTRPCASSPVRLLVPGLLSETKNLPREDAAAGEYRVHQILERGLVPCAQRGMPRNYCLECLDQPQEWSAGHLEAIDQHSEASRKAASRKLDAICHGASIVRIGREDLLDGGVLGAVVAAHPGKLHFDGPAGQFPDSKIARLTACRIAALRDLAYSVSCACISATVMATAASSAKGPMPGWYRRVASRLLTD